MGVAGSLTTVRIPAFCLICASGLQPVRALDAQAERVRNGLPAFYDFASPEGDVVPIARFTGALA